MPISDKEIYQAANTLIQQYGDDAEFVAAGRADEMTEEGDVDGERVWLRIIDAIRVLVSRDPSSPVN